MGFNQIFALSVCTKILWVNCPFDKFLAGVLWKNWTWLEDMLAQAEHHLKWSFEFLGEGFESQNGTWNFMGLHPQVLNGTQWADNLLCKFPPSSQLSQEHNNVLGETALWELPFQQLTDLSRGWNKGRCSWPGGQGDSLRPATVVRRQAQDFYRRRKMALSPSSSLTFTSTCQAYKSDYVNELTDFPTPSGSPPAWVLRCEACWSSGSLRHAWESAGNWQGDPCAATTARTALEELRLML